MRGRRDELEKLPPEVLVEIAQLALERLFLIQTESYPYGKMPTLRAVQIAAADAGWAIEKLIGTTPHGPIGEVHYD